jgi:hypothetical protein
VNKLKDSKRSLVVGGKICNAKGNRERRGNVDTSEVTNGFDMREQAHRLQIKD